MKVFKVELSENGIGNIIFDKGINHVAIITSKLGDVRSNHYHKVGWHYLYIVSGGMIYEERDLDGSNKETAWLSAGQCVYTPPNRVHRTTFTEPTVMISITPNKSQKAQEKDTVKEQFDES